MPDIFRDINALVEKFPVLEFKKNTLKFPLVCNTNVKKQENFFILAV